ncbi:MFS transporter [Denitrificimonas caeni]|uniref:MFS transporter n=1 Tax=Denitrificimonas caeni TaxID=521720 RepID=A0AAE9VNI4_9GAMM|nr:MFS transporter [Denitrificimonas caeni]NLJ12132.1 MFS transporter [Gammaproteobacteria bacterium]WBE25114.1 MFS transporter [Denitrificimonas caeni]
MKPQESRRVLRVLWWLQLIVALLPVWLFPDNAFDLGAQPEYFSLLFFAAALCLLFLNVKPFRRFKHAVIDLGKVLNTEQAADAWQHLMHVRLRALWYACLPAWAAAVGKTVGLELPAIFLLAVATPMLFWLYRTPRQLA